MIYIITIAWLAGIVAVCLLFYSVSERRHWTDADEERDLDEQEEAIRGRT